MKEKIIEILRKVPMPGATKNIVEAGIITDIVEENKLIQILVGLPQKAEKYEQALVPTMQDVLKRELEYDGQVKIKVNILKLNQSTEPGGISKVKNVIAVASGKGGVGKSTVSSNLAISFAKLGYKVGLLDADVFGPSVPTMFGTQGSQPVMEKRGEKDMIIPIEKFGVKMLSVGFFIKPSEAMALRGPMAGNVLKQLIEDTDWGELDVMILDMPPGTSDIQLTIAASIDLTGAVMVSTPQDVALIDLVRGIDFFQKEKIEVPVLGLIENMAWFTPAELPDNKYYIFGKGGAKKLAEDKNIPFLGEVPIVQSIREGGDSGSPIALDDDSMVALYFKQIAEKVAASIKL